MAYADTAYYKGTYGGSTIPDTALSRQLEKASDQIDSMTYNRIAVLGFAALTEFQQAKVKKAVCSHADFIYQFGSFLGLPLSGYSAGSISLTLKTTEAGGGVKTAEEVVNLLRAAGLIDRRL